MPTLSLLRKVSICALLLPLATPVQSAEVATIVVSSVAGGPLDVLGRMLLAKPLKPRARRLWWRTGRVQPVRLLQRRWAGPNRMAIPCC